MATSRESEMSRRWVDRPRLIPTFSLAEAAQWLVATSLQMPFQTEMDVDNEQLVTIPLVIQLAKGRLWTFQCGWTLKRSDRTPGGPCKITLNSWHTLQLVSGMTFLELFCFN